MTCPSLPSGAACPLFTETNTAPASPTRSDTLCRAFSRTVSPCASIRPKSDCPSTVVRSHEDRRASTTSESADGVGGVSPPTGAAGGVDDAGGGTVAGVDGALTGGGVDRTAASVAAGSLPDRNHQIVPTSTAIPAAPKNATNSRARPPEGTGTASLGNGDDSNVRELAVEIDGCCDNGDGDADADGSGCGVACSTSSENTLGGSGGGGSLAGCVSAWNGTVRASSLSASMLARASSSMPLTA